MAKQRKLCLEGMERRLCLTQIGFVNPGDWIDVRVDSDLGLAQEVMTEDFDQDGDLDLLLTPDELTADEGFRLYANEDGEFRLWDAPSTTDDRFWLVPPSGKETQLISLAAEQSAYSGHLVIHQWSTETPYDALQKRVILEVELCNELPVYETLVPQYEVLFVDLDSDGVEEMILTSDVQCGRPVAVPEAINLESVRVYKRDPVTGDLELWDRSRDRYVGNLDTNGDGLQELLLHRIQNGAIKVQAMDGSPLPPIDLGNTDIRGIFDSASVDWNSDGRRDLILGTEGFAEGVPAVILLQQTDDGVEIVSLFDRAARERAWIHIVDFDNDARPDILLRLVDDQAKSAALWGLHNTEAGLRQFKLADDSLLQMNEPIVADTDADGDLDIVVENWSNGVRQRYLFENDGTTNYAPAQRLADLPLVSLLPLATVDIDADGQLEDVVLNFDTGAIEGDSFPNSSSSPEVLIGNYRAPILQQTIGETTISGPIAKPVVMTLHGQRALFDVWDLNQRTRIAALDYLPTHWRFADVDGDDDHDLILIDATATESGQFEVLINPGKSEFWKRGERSLIDGLGEAIEFVDVRNGLTTFYRSRNAFQRELLPALPSEFGVPVSARLADVDGDRLPDLVATTTKSRLVWLPRMTDNQFGEPILIADNVQVSDQHWVTANLISGESTEIVATIGDTIQVYRWSGVSSRLEPSEIAADAGILLTGDANRDGLDELYVSTSDADGHPTVILLSWDGRQIQRDQTLQLSAAPIRFHSIQLSDLNGDGRRDLLALSQNPRLAAWFAGYDPRTDIDRDTELDDIDDINQLCAAVLQHAVDPIFDLNDDGLVDGGDVAAWLVERQIPVGDVNLDGHFNSTDLIQLFALDLFERAESATWGSGDWNCDGHFDSGDLVVAFQMGSYNSRLTKWTRATLSNGIAIQQHDIDGDGDQDLLNEFGWYETVAGVPPFSIYHAGGVDDLYEPPVMTEADFAELDQLADELDVADVLGQITDRRLRDVNGDAVLDLIVVDGIGEIFWVEGPVLGGELTVDVERNYIFRRGFPRLDIARIVSAADHDGDGDIDLAIDTVNDVAIETYYHEAFWAINNGAGDFELQSIVTTFAEYNGQTTRGSELVNIRIGTPGHQEAFLRIESYEFGVTSDRYQFVSGTDRFWLDAPLDDYVHADVDGDGDKDLFGRSGNQLLHFERETPAQFATAERVDLLLSDLATYQLDLLDVDADGIDEWLLSNATEVWMFVLDSVVD